MERAGNAKKSWIVVISLVLIVGIVLTIQGKIRPANWCLRIPFGNPKVAIKDARDKLQFLQEFDALFPDARYFISYYTGMMGDETISAVVGLHGRYVITVKSDISMNWNGRRITTHQPPLFLFQEVESIEIPASGGARIRYTQNQKFFGLEEWRQVVQSGGDFNVIGVEFDSTQPPLEYFGEEWNP